MVPNDTTSGTSAQASIMRTNNNSLIILFRININISIILLNMCQYIVRTPHPTWCTYSGVSLCKLILLKKKIYI